MVKGRFKQNKSIKIDKPEETYIPLFSKSTAFALIYEKDVPPNNPLEVKYKLPKDLLLSLRHQL